jgi:hypothetical protein
MANESLEELRERLLRQQSVQQMIQVRAYEIYQMRGGRPGGEAQDWFHAEGEVLAFLLASESVQTEEPATDIAEVTPVPSSPSEPAKAKKTAGRTRSKPGDGKQGASKSAAAKRPSTKKAPESKPKSRRTSKQSKAEESSQER